MRHREGVEFMKQFLKPNRLVLATFAVLVFLVEWAGIDSWRFTRQGFYGLQDPPLYNFVNQNPLSPLIWLVSLILLLPAYPLHFVFVLISPTNDLNWANRYWTYIYIVPYLYVVACSFSWLFTKLKNRFTRNVAA